MEHTILNTVWAVFWAPIISLSSPLQQWAVSNVLEHLGSAFCNPQSLEGSALFELLWLTTVWSSASAKTLLRLSWIDCISVVACVHALNLETYKHSSSAQVVVALNICKLLRHSLWGSASTHFVAFKFERSCTAFGRWLICCIVSLSAWFLTLSYSFYFSFFVQCWGHVPWPASFWRFWIGQSRI